jgi:chloramphenicol O-acetyltransferase type A
MARDLDLANWARRDLFEFFRGYDNPYFNICTRLDTTALLAYLRARPGIRVSLAYLYLALRVANEIEPFRYRLRDGRVIVHDVINGGTTVLLPNESFAFAYFDYLEDFETFAVGAGRAIKEVETGNGRLTPTTRDDVVYFTTLPWVSFTSFTNAHNLRRADSVPRIAFGKFATEAERVMLPISIEVHHALMDGLHVGRYLTKLEEALMEPERYLTPKEE